MVDIADLVLESFYDEDSCLQNTIWALQVTVVSDDTSDPERVEAAHLAFTLIHRTKTYFDEDLDGWKSDLQRAVALRVLCSIAPDDEEGKDPNQALELYAVDPGVKIFVQELLIRALLRCAQNLVHDERIDVPDAHLVRAMDTVSSYCAGTSRLRPWDSYFDPDEDYLEGDCALVFLLALAARDATLSESFYCCCLGLLTILLRTSSKLLFDRSSHALQSLLVSLPTVRPIEHLEGGDQGMGILPLPDWMPELFWSTIYTLTYSSQLNDRNTAGFAIWLRALSGTRQLFDLQTLRQDEYWQILRKGLSVGSSEQRKYALRILLSSIPMTNDEKMPSMLRNLEDAGHVTKGYMRYAALFETIVLSRYLNQVQDSLPDLAKLCHHDSAVHPAWIVTLLQAALKHGMQDSIRKVIGSWTLTNGLNVVAASGIAGSFLKEALLPWAALGYHCTSSVRHTSQGLVCDHGEQLAGFLARLIGQTAGASKIVRSSLEFLCLQDRHIFPFGRTYILEGLLRGCQNTHPVLDEECLSIVLRVHSVQGFQSLVQDLMIVQCCELASCASKEAQDACNLLPLKNARNELRHTKDFERSMRECAQTLLRDTAPGSYEALSASAGRMEALTALLRDTKHRCLWQSGLEACQQYMTNLLEEVIPPGLDSQCLTQIIEALWEEMEVQEHPRKALMIFPNLLLHPVCLSLCRSDSDLRRLVSRLTLDLQKLSNTRIYLFSSLAENIRKAVLYGPGADVLPIEQVLINYANDPQSTRIEFQLELAVASKLEAYEPSRTYSSYYGKLESYGHACIFNMLNRLSRSDPLRSQCMTILNILFQQWVDQKQPVPVFSKWKKSTQLQLALLCLENCVPTLDDNSVGVYMEKVLTVLSFEPLPRFRYLLEWIVVRILVHRPERRLTMLDRQEAMDISNPKYLVSIMKINLLSALLPDTTEDFGLELMTQLIPLSASPKIVIRHEAQWTFAPLWDCAVERRWSGILDNPAFARLNKNIRSLETYKTPPTARLLERFHPVRDHNLTHLLEGDYLRIEPSESARTGHKDLLQVLEDDSLTSAESRDMIMPLGSAPSIAHKGNEDSAPLLEPLGHNESISAPLQTKAAQQIDLGSMLSALPDQAERRTVQPVIVVASFIDNPFNLGSLSRLSEINGAQSLQVHDKRVLANKDFKSVSVASHLWLPIEELKANDVSAFLRQHKKAGYTVVGIEQTDSSRVLGAEDCKLPTKIVLVLGSEREGIPAHILADLDFAVEIQQSGVTRSMNVQTAAACVLYEYSRQRRHA